MSSPSTVHHNDCAIIQLIRWEACLVQVVEYDGNRDVQLLHGIGQVKRSNGLLPGKAWVSYLTSIGDAAGCGA
jgi:hypothetical protein